VAVYLLYRRGEQTPEAVEYRWGPSEEDLSSRVVLDPRDPTAWPTVGGDHAQMPMVVRAVIRRLRATGTWPERGVVQH
jgi:hypothetical protein